MKIAAVASIKSNKTNRIYNKSRQIQKNNFQQADSASFKNKELSQEISFMGRGKELLAGGLAALMLLAGCGNNSNSTAPATEPEASTGPTYSETGAASTEETSGSTEPIIIENDDNQEEKLVLDFGFQKRQGQDTPSLTFDFTENYQPLKLKPSVSHICLSEKPDKKNEFTDLNSIIKNVYGVKDKDVQAKWLVAQAILKTNPWMADLVAQGIVDFEEGDITNIDPELILSTDYSTSETEGKEVYLPEVNVLVRTEKNNKTFLNISTEFTPAGGDENGELEIELSKEDFAKAKSYNEKVAILNDIIANEYQITTMDSCAGVAIWHGIAIDESNYEIFEKASEKDTRKALLDYINKNGSITLLLPRIAVTVIDDKNQDMAVKELLAKNNSEFVISYIASNEAVYDLSGMEDKIVRPIDILDKIILADGISLKKVFEADKETYAGLALAAWRQIVDNDNYLLNTFGITEFVLGDLYMELDYNDFSDEDARINLQPIAIAYAQPKGSGVTSGSKPTKPTIPNDSTDPTDPSDSTKPTDPSDPTKPADPTDPTKPADPTDPTKPADPTDPTDPDCEDLPDVGVSDETIGGEKPQLPPGEGEGEGEEGEEGGEGGEGGSTEFPYCPTEPSQPPTDEIGKPIEDEVGGL